VQNHATTKLDLDRPWETAMTPKSTGNAARILAMQLKAAARKESLNDSSGLAQAEPSEPKTPIPPKEKVSSDIPNPVVSDLESSQYQLMLPLYGEAERAIPNTLARTSLFAPIAAGNRPLYDRELIAGRSDIKIYYTGRQLDMADSDVFMQALAEQKKHPVGNNFFINRGAFLRSMGRTTGKSDYKWLHESIRRLSLGALEIEAGPIRIEGEKEGKTRERLFHLIAGYDLDENVDQYYLRLDPRVIELFKNHQFGLVDWNKRLAITKQRDMAKWLQNYISTHQKGTHRIGLHFLREWMCYSSPVYKFRAALIKALDELARLEIIKDQRLEMSTRDQEQAAWEKI
jgi:hypothetical protein